MKQIFIETTAVNRGHYVPGIVSAGMLYISGQLPMDHKTGKMVTGDIEDQTQMALHNVELVLSAAGLSRKDVVQCRIYIPNVAYWDTVNRIYADFFGEHKAARVIVPCRDLHHGALIEIEAVAEMTN